MALFATLTLFEMLILGVLFVVGGLIVHFIASVMIYGNTRYLRRAGNRLSTVFQPEIEKAGQRVVRGIYASLAESIEKDPEALVGLVDPFLPHIWEYFIHRLDLLKADIVKTAGDGTGALLPAGLGMLGNIIPKEFQGLAEQFLPMIGGGMAPTSGSTPAPASGGVFKSIR